jgi:hypothetical protein
MTLIQRLSLIANGKEELKFMRGCSAFYKDCILFDHTGTRDDTAPAQGPENLTCIIPINISMPKALDPIDSMLPTIDLRSFKLEVLYGTLNDLISGIENDATLTGVYFDVWGELKTHKDVIPTQHREKYSDSKELVVNNNFEIELDKLNIARLWLRGWQTDANGVLIPFDLGAAFATTVKIVAGNFKTDEVPFVIVANQQLREFGSEGWESPNFATFPYYLIDFVRDGKFTNTLDCRDINDPKIFINIATVVNLIDPFIEVMYDYIEDADDERKNDGIFAKDVVKRSADNSGISYETAKTIIAPISKDTKHFIDLEKIGGGNLTDVKGTSVLGSGS